MDPLQELKGFDAGHYLALIKLLGGRETVDAILRGEKSVTVADAIRLLVDRHGRCIPLKPEITTLVCNPNRDYDFDTLPPDFAVNKDWLRVWEQLFNQPAQFNEQEFNERLIALKGKISAKSKIVNLLSGPYFPVLLPQIELGKGGYGAMLEKLILPAVKQGYTKAFSQRSLINCRYGELADQVTIVDEGHQKLVKDLTEGQALGMICFPFQGFSVHAQRQMAKLMLVLEFISLCGPIEIGAAEAIYPKLLSKDSNTPGKDCSAIQWRGSDYSLHFSANDDELRFGSESGIGVAGSNFSGGLFLRG